jgi:L-fucose isomerase-like protein
MRATDSQCGVMATGKVLRQFGVPFTYMTNCNPDDEVFERTMRAFLNAAHVVKAMKGLRIGQISVRPDAFWSVKCNELQLLEKFGVEVVPVTLIEIQQRYLRILESRRAELEPIVADYKQVFDVRVDEESLYRAAALKTARRIGRSSSRFPRWPPTAGARCATCPASPHASPSAN